MEKVRGLIGEKRVNFGCLQGNADLSGSRVDAERALQKMVQLFADIDIETRINKSEDELRNDSGSVDSLQVENEFF